MLKPLFGATQSAPSPVPSEHESVSPVTQKEKAERHDNELGLKSSAFPSTSSFAVDGKYVQHFFLSFRVLNRAVGQFSFLLLLQNIWNTRLPDLLHEACRSLQTRRQSNCPAALVLRLEHAVFRDPLPACLFPNHPLNFLEPDLGLVL